MLNWIFGGIGKAAESIGTAVNKNIKTLKGDKAEAEEHVHAEQMAVLNQYTAEFAGRPPKNAWDSFIDGLNRLPRPLLTFGIIGLFFWAIIDPGGFINVMAALEIIPDELWTLFMLVVGFFFGGRFVKEDLARPKLTEAQQRRALEIVKERENTAIERKKAAEDDRPIVAIPPAEPIRRPEQAPDIPIDRTKAAAIDQMIASLMQREGGYVNHPADRGGPTNRGITLATLAAWRGTPCSADDVKALSDHEAAKIYRASYYIAPGIDTLPIAIQSHVFDIGVNSGPRAAIKMLQRTLNKISEQVTVDGIIGNVTRDAARRHDAAKINATLAETRIAFYNDIVASDPSQKVFLTGWTKRANEFMAA